MTPAIDRLQEKPTAQRVGWLRTNLDCQAARLYLTGMTFVLAQKIELQDRARLRERFYGAARAVLARL